MRIPSGEKQSYVRTTNYIYNQFGTLDKAYEKARNDLIPLAEDIANEAAGPKPEYKTSASLHKEETVRWKNLHMRVFLHAMDILAKERELLT
jgi:cytochrome c2